MYGGVWGRINLALVLGAGLLIGTAPARGADLGGDCCADLEERIAELESTAARKGNRKVSLTIGGYINEALLFWDDGRLHDVYQGTNDVARSRFRFQGDAKIDKDWSAGYLLEIGVRTNRLNRTDQFHARGITTDPDVPGGFVVAAPLLDVRHSAWFIQHKDYGRLWIGQTDQATERITEITTSNTNLYLKHYGRWNNSFILRRKDNDTLTLGNPPSDSNTQVFGTTTTNANFRTWGQLLPQSGFTGEGVPGEGDRFSVIKFDTAEYGGFVASAAWGEDDFWDVALRYAGEHHGYRVVGGIGYSAWSGVGSLNTRGCSIAIKGQPASLPSPNSNSQFDTGESECSQLGLSGSVMHIDTGLFVTGAYGIKWDDNRSAAFNGVTGTGSVANPAFTPASSVDDTDSFYSVTVGLEQKLKALGLDKFGKTTIFADYEHYDTGAIISANGLTATGRPRTFGPGSGFGGPGGLGYNQLGSGAEIDVWGAGFNQNFESAALDVYVAYRWAESELTTTDNGAKDGPNARTWEFVPIQMLMAGSRIQF